MNRQNVLLLAVLLSATVSNGAVIVRVNFTKTRTCPSNASLSRLAKLEGSLDTRTCFADCAVMKNCSVVFRSSSAVCYFGSREELETNFSVTNIPGPEPCESYVRTWEWSNMGPAEAANQLTAANISSNLLSKLVIFIDFRQGYANLANPSKYNATAYGSVSRNGSGAYFPGNSHLDYIEVDTDGSTLASTYLTNSQKFTFYARLVREGIYQTYHYFYDCSSTDNRGEFYDDGEKLRIKHAYPDGSFESKKTNNDYFSSSRKAASVGAVFNGDSLSNFFVDGSFRSKEDSDSGSYSGQPQCLRLGYNGSPSNALKGRFICYAVANDTLSLSELCQLHDYCSM